ncbi:MAG: molybdenum cofactor guanylyltransferase [Deltaproteobacteria bacterium]|nr:molybdenum cofactor guanylyltransferase [Deltaproteobacteria bacterium]
MERVPIYLLAGGESRRFGSEKARAVRGGVSLLTGLATALEERATRLTAVARTPGQYADLGLRTVADLRPGMGPLGGLEAALLDLRPEEPWLLLCACDVIGVRAGWVEDLVAGCCAGAKAVAFRGARWEPLFALYHRSIAPLVGAQLDEGTLSMWRLLEEARAVALPLPEGWGSLRNANRREDLE